MEDLFVGLTGRLREFLHVIEFLPSELAESIVLLVKILAILVFVLINGLFLPLYVERRVAAYMQARIGPNRVGPKGLLQPVADMLKMLGKEIVIPKKADIKVFLLAPVLIFVPTLMVFAVIPFGRDMAAIDMNIGLFYFLAVASLSTLFIWMGGWASNSKYSLIGAMRVVAQMVSYELPLVLSLLGVVMIVGSLKLSDIVAAQEHIWFIFTQPVAFLIFFTAGVAETNRTPFCVVEGESEIIAGPYTEYGGMGFGMYGLSEFANIMLMCALATTMFLGGWQAPFGLTFIPSWIWFLLKMYALIFIVIQFRWTFPRIRIDQLMGFSWKVLLPLALANIFVTGIGMFVYRAIGW